MIRKNKIKTASFILVLLMGVLFFTQSFNVEASTSYSKETFTTQGETDFGVCGGKVYDIKTFYDTYVSKDAVTTRRIDGTLYGANSGCDNYAVGYHQILLYGDDPITAFVDKEYLINPGDYVLYGKEYGYYVHTEMYHPVYDVTTSRILLLDFSFNKGDFKNNGDIDSKCYFKVNVVSETAVVTLNYDLVKEEFWKGNNPENYQTFNAYINDEDDCEMCVQNYVIGKECRPSDGYLVAPVLESDWSYSDANHYNFAIASCKSISATGIYFEGFFEDLGDKNTETFSDLNFNLNVPVLKFQDINNDRYYREIFSEVWEEMKQVASDFPKEFGEFLLQYGFDWVKDKILEVVPGGQIIDFAIEFEKFKQELYQRIFDKARSKGQQFKEDYIDTISSKADFRRFGKSVNYRMDSFLTGSDAITTDNIKDEQELISPKDFLVVTMNAHGNFIQPIFDCYDVENLDTTIAFGFTPVYKKWHYNGFGPTYYEYIYPEVTFVNNYSKDSTKLIIEELLGSKNIYDKDIQSFANIDKNLYTSIGSNGYSSEIEVTPNYSKLYKLTADYSGKYAFELSSCASNLDFGEILIWDEDSKELCGYSVYYSNRKRVEFETIANHDYIVLVRARGEFNVKDDALLKELVVLESQIKDLEGRQNSLSLEYAGVELKILWKKTVSWFKQSSDEESLAELKKRAADLEDRISELSAQINELKARKNEIKKDFPKVKIDVSNIYKEVINNNPTC